MPFGADFAHVSGVSHVVFGALQDHPVMAELSESVRALLSQVATHRRYPYAQESL